MTYGELARSYLEKSRRRLRAVSVLLEDGGFSDVMREAQEVVELALKGILRAIGVDPPHWHDVGGILRRYADKLPAIPPDEIAAIEGISRYLFQERERSFYGDVDLIPTEIYDRVEAETALRDARWIVEVASRAIPKGPDA